MPDDNTKPPSNISAFRRAASRIMLLAASAFFIGSLSIEFFGDLGNEPPDVAKELIRKEPQAFSFDGHRLAFHMSGENVFYDLQLKKNSLFSETMNLDAMSGFRNLIGHPGKFETEYHQTHMRLRKNGECHLNWEPADFSTEGISSSPMQVAFMSGVGDMKTMQEITLLHEIGHCAQFVADGEDFDVDYLSRPEKVWVTENYADVRAIVTWHIAHPEQDWKKISKALISSRVFESEFSHGDLATHATMSSIDALIRHGIPEDIGTYSSERLHSFVKEILKEGGITEEAAREKGRKKSFFSRLLGQ